MINSEVPFLIAMPSLKNSMFHKTLILIGEKDATGAMGIILNVKTKTKVKDVLKLMNIESDLFDDTYLSFGGPVQTDFCWVLHSSDFTCSSTMKINKHLSISSALDVLPLLKKERLPMIYQIGVGYAGWGADQLDREIQEGSWWSTNIAQEKILSLEDELKWDKAFELMGVNAQSLFDDSKYSFLSN